MKIEIDIPDGISGDWKVETFTLTEKDISIFNLREIINQQRTLKRRFLKPGTYKRLTRNSEVIMSNTPAECQDLKPFIDIVNEVGGDILINGLGLGVALKSILDFGNINSITVIEKSTDVLNLVAPYVKDERITIINADALTYKPVKKRYTVVWHDIWDDICVSNLKEMSILHRKYGKRCDWQGSWCKENCLYVRKYYK